MTSCGQEGVSEQNWSSPRVVEGTDVLASGIVEHSSPNQARDCVKTSFLTRFSGQCKPVHTHIEDVGLYSTGLNISHAHPEAFACPAWAMPRLFDFLARSSPTTDVLFSPRLPQLSRLPHL
jgi:hypothetical protein